MTAATFLEAFQILLNLASNLQQLSAILFRMNYLIAKLLVKILKDRVRKKNLFIVFFEEKNHSNDLILLSFLSLHLFFLSVDEKHFALPSYNLVCCIPLPHNKINFGVELAVVEHLCTLITKSRCITKKIGHQKYG